MTSGVVGEMEHQVLPSIPPILTMVLTLIAILVCIYYTQGCIGLSINKTVCAVYSLCYCIYGESRQPVQLISYIA